MDDVDGAAQGEFPGECQAASAGARATPSPVRR